MLTASFRLHDAGTRWSLLPTSSSWLRDLRKGSKSRQQSVSQDWDASAPDYFLLRKLCSAKVSLLGRHLCEAALACCSRQNMEASISSAHAREVNRVLQGLERYRDLRYARTANSAAGAACGVISYSRCVYMLNAPRC